MHVAVDHARHDGLVRGINDLRVGRNDNGLRLADLSAPVSSDAALASAVGFDRPRIVRVQLNETYPEEAWTKVRKASGQFEEDTERELRTAIEEFKQKFSP